MFNKFKDKPNTDDDTPKQVTNIKYNGYEYFGDDFTIELHYPGSYEEFILLKHDDFIIPLSIHMYAFEDVSYEVIVNINNKICERLIKRDEEIRFNEFKKKYSLE